MRRRTLIGGIGSAAAWPLIARAQQRAIPIVGYLGIRPPADETPYLAAFRKGLNESGFVESRNLMLAISSAENKNDQLSTLARQLVNRKVAAIAAAGTAATQAVKAATATTPIIFVSADDPVENGLTTSLNRPTGNVTGVSMVSAELRPKMLELLHEAAPQLNSVFMLANPNNASIEIQAKQTQAAADKFGMNFKILRASNPTDIDAVFTTFSQRSSTGLLVNSDPFLTGRRSQIVALAARYAIPAIYPWREYVLEGGLMSYGSSNIESYRMAGVYVGRILNGAQPKELPIMQPTIFELAINLKTARALGMSVSSAILARADEVIE